MTTMTDAQAIAYIVNCANGKYGFDKDTVENMLARYFMGMVFRTSTGTATATAILNNNQPLMPYSVGFASAPGATGNRMCFEDKVVWGTNSPYQILSAFVVPMRRAAGPPLPSMSLNLNASATGPKMVLTSQLIGCTFAIGAVGHVLHMAHAQPLAGSSGKTLAEALHNGPDAFDGLPAAGLSTFLIYPGDTVEHTSTGLCYGNKANILGLVVNHGTSYTITVIVAIMNRNTSDKIEKVMLVTRENSKWATEVVV